MIFNHISIPEVLIIEPEIVDDERGFFARTWCQNEMKEHNINIGIVQCNISFNRKKGTIRGLHLQTPPFAEDKLVRCTMGTIFDVVVDLRTESPTYLKWFALELSSDNRKMIFIPKGVAHGFQTLLDNSEVFYQMSEFYHPENSFGIRWDDPLVNIDWPIPISEISDKDKSYSSFQIKI